MIRKQYQNEIVVFWGLVFVYDANGMRTKRTNGSTTYSYIYNGSQLSYMGVGSNELYFSYDGMGNPLKVLYNGTQYYYVTNLQGDILRILDEDRNTVVEYTYDAWGKLISTTGTKATTLGAHNPLRYRGYVYDVETGLYYLQSRYYNPAMGRFINADAFASTGQGLLGNNMFAYCNNNPANFADPNGYFRHHVKITQFDGYTCSGPVSFPDDVYGKMEGMINGQALFEYAGDSVGWLGTYADNGCGPIAVYNAMQLLNDGKSLGSIDDYLGLHFGYFTYGLLGANPFAIRSYFHSMGYETTTYLSVDALSQDVYEGSVIVFMVWNDKSDLFSGAHYMTAQYSGGQYIVYNIYSDDPSSKPVGTLDPVYGNSHWIAGIIVR